MQFTLIITISHYSKEAEYFGPTNDCSSRDFVLEFEAAPYWTDYVSDKA